MSVIGTIPHDTIPAEPPNKSIVGWGDPTSEVCLRLDEVAGEANWQEGQRWFNAADVAFDEEPLTWQAVCDANASSGEPYLLSREPLRATSHVPAHSLDILGRTDEMFDPTEAVQFGVRDPNGKTTVYGDQGWVAHGVCIDDGSHPDGKIKRRDLTITYGEWVDHHG